MLRLGSHLGMKHISLTLALVVIATLGPAPAQARVRLCNGYKVTKAGTNGNDTLRGTPKRDVIAGLGGNDVIRGADGRDILCGGRGRDTLYGQRDNDFLDGDRGKDLLLGGRAGDGGTGDEGADELRMGTGDDWIEVGEDSGRDLIDGGPGPDFIDLSVTDPSEGEPDDASGPAFVDLATGVVNSADGGENQVVVGTVENVYGTGAGDEIHGDEGPNVLDPGYNGGGTLYGRGGGDILTAGQDGGTTYFGGAGNDIINPLESNEIDGGAGTDELDFCGPSARISLDISVDIARGRSEVRYRDEVFGINNFVEIEDVITCGGDDELLGDEKDNLLDSGPDHDSIDGREGSDTCLGGEEVANCEA